jgi:hypothetical protein
MEVVNSAEISGILYQNEVRRIAEDLTPHENPKSHIYNS